MDFWHTDSQNRKNRSSTPRNAAVRINQNCNKINDISSLLSLTGGRKKAVGWVSCVSAA
jgi:hypothetical protein